MTPTPAQERHLRANFRPGRVEFSIPFFRIGVEPVPLAFICENISL